MIFSLEDENVLAKATQKAFLLKLIEYEKKVREDRRRQFEEWDKNSANLIAQYERELVTLIPEPSESKTKEEK